MKHGFEGENYQGGRKGAAKQVLTNWFGWSVGAVCEQWSQDLAPSSALGRAERRELSEGQVKCTELDGQSFSLLLSFQLLGPLLKPYFVINKMGTVEGKERI